MIDEHEGFVGPLIGPRGDALTPGPPFSCEACDHRAGGIVGFSGNRFETMHPCPEGGTCVLVRVDDRDPS